MLRPSTRGEEPVRQLEDLRARSIVLRQRDDPRAGIAVGKPGQELARRAGERVDRLVLVPDDAQVGAVAEPQLEQPLLERVRVLVLVDADPALACADGLDGVGVRVEQVDGLAEEVIEVDPARARLRALVSREDPDEQVDRGGSRPVAAAPVAARPPIAAAPATARSYVVGVRRRLFAHSISSARSLTAVNR